MADLLVRLYALPPAEPAIEAAGAAGITVRRAAAAERGAVVEWVRTHGSPGWASECEASFVRQPLACFVAVDGAKESKMGRLAGVACYEATCRGFFGPEIVHPDHRGKGVGRALLLSALHAMRAEGYGYAIIGWASSIDFYKRVVGAVVIEGSDPGVYPAKLLR
jgi:GNAT superfamily N-acetyltransferase